MPTAALLPLAIGGAGILGAGATVFGANKAAAAQKAAADRATDAQMKMFGVTREALDPFIKSGAQAGGLANRLLGTDASVDMSILEKLPGYQFALEQGLKGVQNSAAARGLGSSGAALKGAANFATGLANQQFGDHLSRLLTAETIGANAAAGLGTNATATGANVGNNILGSANAQAGATMAGANAIGGAANNAVSGLLVNKLLSEAGANGAPAAGGMYSTLANGGLSALY